MASSDHAVLPPSSAGAWVHCHGWVAMNAMFPNDAESEESRIGTAVHELGALMLTDTNGAVAVDNVASNGVVWNDEAFECAELYANDVRSVVAQYPNGILTVEEHIEIGYVHDENSGTPDAVLFDPDSRAIYIWDYKHGYGVVEAYENYQLSDYLVGVMFKYGVTEEEVDSDADIYLRVVQPRAIHRDGPIRTWHLKASEVRKYATALKTAALANLDGTGQCQSGSHCRYCNARHACPASIEAGMHLYEVASAPTPLRMPPEAMALQYEINLRAMEHLKSMNAAFETQLFGKIRQGETIPGWELRDTKGRTVWDKPAEEIFILGDLMGVDLRKAPEAITPKQAQKLGVKLMPAFTKTPTTGVALVKVDPSRARRIFGA